MRSLLLLALLVVVPARAGAQEGPDDSLMTVQLDPIVVTGTRVEVARSNVPLTVSTVPGTTIRQSAEVNVLPVVTRSVPGVFVTERGMVGYGISNGSAGHIRIRGVGGSPNTNVLVMVDGHPQFMGIFGHPFPDAYVSSDAERVEVVRGPASILYGTGAMGGVINIITTRLHEDGVRGAVSAAYGSHATQHYSANGGIRRNGKEAFVSINHDRTNGHRAALDDFDLTNAYLKLGSALTERWRLTIDGRLTQFHTEDPGTIAAPNDSVAQDADVLRTRVALSLENRHTNSEGALKAYYNYGEHVVFDGFESEDYNAGIVAYQAYRMMPGFVVTVGLDAKRYGGASRNVLGDADFGDHSVTEVGGYGFLQYAPITRLMLSGGTRVESNSVFGAEVAPQIGAAYHVGMGTTLKASVAKGYRSPTVLELYLFPPANPDLEPERLWNYEVALLHAANRLEAELVVFISQGSNVIEVQGAFPNVLRQNVGEFTNKGLELHLAYLLMRGLTVSGNVSYLDMETPIVGAPEWHGFADVTYVIGPVSAGVELQVVQNLNVGAPPPPPPGAAPVIEDYTLLNARAAYRPTDFAEIFVRLENLLDEQYQINLGYPMPGTTFMSGVRLRF